MKTRKSLLIAFAVLSVLSLLAYGNIEKAFALEIVQKATGDQPRTVDGSQSSNLTAVVNSNDDTISVYNSATGALTRTIDFSSAFSGIGAGVANHIECSPTTLPYCITFVDTASTDRIFMININNGQVGTISSGINFTGSAPLSGSTAFEINCAVAQQQCTVWVFRDSAAAPAGSVFIRVYSTTLTPFGSPWVLVAEYDTGLSTSNDVKNVEYANQFMISGNGYNLLAYFHDGTAFRVFNTGTGTQACSIASGLVTNPQVVFGDTGTSNDIWLWARDGNGLSRVTHSSPTACAIANTISVTQFESNNPIAVDYNTNTGEYYVAVASGSIYTVNGTTFLTTAELVTSATIIIDSMFYDSSIDVLASAINTDDVINFFFFEGTGSEDNPVEGSSGGVCLNVDSNGDGRVNVLDCVGGASAFAGFTGGQNVTDVTANITDGLGLTNCGDNPDHETCGSGLFLFLILLLLSEALALAGYLGFVRLTNADAHLMDVGLLILIIAFTDIAIGFYLNWIPDVVFYTIVVLVAGLLTFGILTRFRGGG